MLREETAQGCRGALIEEYTHLCGGKSTACSMLEHGAHLFNSDTRKPLYKLRYQRTVFEILEQRCHRHPSTGKHPCATYALGIALNCRT